MTVPPSCGVFSSAAEIGGSERSFRQATTRRRSARTRRFTRSLWQRDRFSRYVIKSVDRADDHKLARNRAPLQAIDLIRRVRNAVDGRHTDPLLGVRGVFDLADRR